MKIDGIVQLNQFDTAAFERWLIDGAERMVGVRPGIEAAFAPVEAHVGQSRDRNWIEDIAWGVNPELDQPASHRLCSALNAAMRDLAPQVCDDNWRVTLHLIELTRMLQIEQRADGLGALALRLGQPGVALAPERRRSLLAAALLALCESLGDDRRPSAQFALRVARQLLRSEPALTATQRAAILRRLLALPAVDAAALAAAGFDAAPDGASRRPSVFHGDRERAAV